MTQRMSLSTLIDRKKSKPMSLSLKEKLDQKTVEFSKGLQKGTMKADNSSLSSGKRKHKLLYTPGTMSSPFNEHGSFLNLMGKLDFANMSSADYSNHIKELNATIIFDSKKNKTFQCPECIMFSTSEKEEFVKHKKIHSVNETSGKKVGNDRTVKKV